MSGVHANHLKTQELLRGAESAGNFFCGEGLLHVSIGPETTFIRATAVPHVEKK